MKCIKLILLGTLFCTKLAFASLVATDLLVPGDKLLTVDTATNLEWLDLTQTTNLSVGNIMADQGGWLTSGFRYATLAETTQLFVDAGFPDSFTTSTAYFNNAIALQGLLGVTFVYNAPGFPSGDLYYMTRGYLNDANLNNGLGFSLVVVSADMTTLEGAAGRPGYSPDGGANSTIGSWLVREAPIAPLPIPPSIFLFSTGAIFLMVLVRNWRPRRSLS